MKLIPCDVAKVGDRRARSKNYRFLREFMDSEHDCVKVEEYPQKDAKACAGSLNLSIKRFYSGLAFACQRDGEVYLVKTIALTKKNSL